MQRENLFKEKINDLPPRLKKLINDYIHDKNLIEDYYDVKYFKEKFPKLNDNAIDFFVKCNHQKIKNNLDTFKIVDKKITLDFD